MKYAVLLLSALCVVLGLSAWHYKTRASALSFALDTQNTAIEAQNREAERKLRDLTAERDILKRVIDERAAAQRKIDGQAKTQIASDDARAAAVSVSVRCSAGPARPRGDGGASKEGAATAARGGDAVASSGILAPEADRRFKRSVSEIETLQAAFNSCKQTLLGEPA